MARLWSFFWFVTRRLHQFAQLRASLQLQLYRGTSLKKSWLLLAFLSFTITPGFAATLGVTPGSGVNLLGVNDGSSNFSSTVNIGDGTNPDNRAPVSATTGLGVNLLDGSDVTLGAIADAAASAGGTGTVSAKLRETTSLLNSIVTNTSGATPAGTNIIGKVGIDQTTTGTTNGVAIVGVNTAVASTAASGVLKVGIVGNAGGAFDAAGQNAASPANSLLTACQYNSSPTTITSGNVSPVQCNNLGSVNVNIASGGTVAIGSTTSGQGGSLVFGAATTGAPSLTTGQSNPLSMTLGGSLRTTTDSSSQTQPIPAASGGTSVYSAIVANNTTSVAVKSSAGQIYGLRVFSNNTTQVYGKLYNASQGSTTCGSGTPQDRFSIPASTGGAGFVVPIPFGEAFSTAITLCITGGIADNDTTAPAATSYLVSVDYR